MKRLFIVACIATLILIGFTSQPAYAAGESIYIVQPGDTLFTIAARYHISVNDLAAANGLNGSLWVYPGQQLIIPIFSPFSEPPPFAGATNQLVGSQAVGFTPLPNPLPSTGVYTIRPGDTLYSVANRYGVTLADLQAANGLIDFSLPIYVGQQFVMPMGAIDSSPGSILTPPDLSAPPNWTGSGWTNANIPPQSWTAYSAQSRNFYRAARPSLPFATLRTQPRLLATPNPHVEKWVDVNLTRQTLTAYEGRRPVFGARVSTGIWQYPTVVGAFAIYVKYEAADMEGGSGDDAYYLPNVPYIMYFHGNYGLHGAYWHNNFGTPMSHGCVNLSTPDARWLFHWAPVGTKVVTHY